MKAFCGALVLCTALCPVAGLHAEEATPQGAARLTETLQAYLGRNPGLVTVTAEGASYELRLDAVPLLSGMPDGLGSVRMTPLVADLTDRGDGTWDVAMDQAFELSVAVAGQSALDVTVEEVRVTGVFDESLRAMRWSVTDMTGLSILQSATLPDGGEASTRQTVASLHLESDAVAAGRGGVDLIAVTTMTDLSQVDVLPRDPGGGVPFEVTTSIGRYQADSLTRGLRTAEILDVVAWLVAHPSAEEVVAAQEEMRGLLSAAMPLLDGARAIGEISDVAVASPFGTFGLRRATTASEVSGIVAAGRARFGGTLEGLELPPAILPVSAEVIPQDISLDVEVTGFDLAGPAAILIGAFDLSRPEPLEATILEPLTRALLPGGVVRATLAPGRMTAPLFELGYDGNLTLGPAALPVGRASVTLQGFDALYSALQDAPGPEGADLLQSLSFARGMARQGDDLLTWDFALTSDGHLTLNGADLGPMAGEDPWAAP